MVKVLGSEHNNTFFARNIIKSQLVSEFPFYVTQQLRIIRGRDYMLQLIKQTLFIHSSTPNMLVSKTQSSIKTLPDLKVKVRKLISQGRNNSHRN